MLWHLYNPRTLLLKVLVQVLDGLLLEESVLRAQTRAFLMRVLLAPPLLDQLSLVPARGDVAALSPSLRVEDHALLELELLLLVLLREQVVPGGLLLLHRVQLVDVVHVEEGLLPVLLQRLRRVLAVVAAVRIVKTELTLLSRVSRRQFPIHLDKVFILLLANLPSSRGRLQLRLLLVVDNFEVSLLDRGKLFLFLRVEFPAKPHLLQFL